MTKKSSD